MNHSVTVKETSLDEVFNIHITIPEFDEIQTKEALGERYAGKEHLIIAGYVDDLPAGYIIGYEKFNDGSFYCWMAGVSPQFRRMGVLKALMKYFEDWCKDNGYSKVIIKTRNTRREMLAFLVNYGFDFVGVEKFPEVRENRVLLEKRI